MKMIKRVAIYARVSTDDQSPENQLLELEEVAKRMQWSIIETYVDHGVSGAKGRENRAAFNALCEAAIRREFDIIMAWSVDRLGRSLQQLVEFLSDIHAKKIDLYLHKQGIDTTTPTGKAMFHLCGVFAEFERSIIRERVHSGLNRARERGKKLGRPRVGLTVEDNIKKCRVKGMGIKKIAKQLGIGVSVVQRVVHGQDSSILLTPQKL
jgi:DNA invertase Pin-like site-specific DNA recombinase